jgi:formylglycine-generating enzyme required for sulfatase activity
VVITMRSEFLGECVRYRGLPEIINEGQYLVPRLTGDNVRRAVAGPLGVVGAPVDATLVNRLVREVGDNMDQLPLLQHALMRTYRRRQQQGGDTPISHADYEAVGCMDQALGLHADELFGQLDATGRAVAKLIFQRLTDLSAGDKGGRRPTLMTEIYGLAQALPADRAAVDAVIEQFRQLDTSFLMPPPGAPLQDESMLDISHESLIRNWAMLNDWAKEEAENARLYQRLQQARAEHDDDPSQGWITSGLLQQIVDWRKKTPVNHFWAARYHTAGAPHAHDWQVEQGRYERNMAFLAECQSAEANKASARDAEIADKARAKAKARFQQVIIAVVSVAALLAAGLAVWAFREKEIAHKAQKETAEALNKVEQEKEATEQQRGIAEAKTREAEAILQLADENLKKAQAEEARARAALAQVEKEKAATEEQRQAALKNFEEAEKQRKLADARAQEAREAFEKQKAALQDVVRLTLAEVDRLIYDLDYNAAHEKIRTVQNLGVSQQEVSDALLEFAFWYAETGVTREAWGVLDTACALAGRPPADRAAGPRAAIRALNPDRDRFLAQRYFPVMVEIPGGQATIGADTFVAYGDTFSYPPFVVRVSNFQLARTETTWWQYMLYCAAAGVEPRSVPGWGMKGDNPVVNVSWYDVVQYANWLSEKQSLPAFYTINKTLQDMLNKSEYDDLKWTVLPRSNSGYRLPTEAEWEYAARAGTDWTFAGCNTAEQLGDYAWYDQNSDSRTRAVGRKKPNPFGLYDMSGNAWEWCWDWYGDYPKSAEKDYAGPSEGSDRVVRGGSWNNSAEFCRAAYRAYSTPTDRATYLGFRLALQ